MSGERIVELSERFFRRVQNHPFLALSDWSGIVRIMPVRDRRLAEISTSSPNVSGSGTRIKAGMPFNSIGRAP
jgi:hypothetical protein